MAPFRFPYLSVSAVHIPSLNAYTVTAKPVNERGVKLRYFLGFCMLLCAFFTKLA